MEGAEKYVDVMLTEVNCQTNRIGICDPDISCVEWKWLSTGLQLSEVTGKRHLYSVKHNLCSKQNLLL
jgi:hypothetical protein